MLLIRMTFQEQSSGAKGSSAAAVEKEAAHALHRSESVSSSRSNRCIHINNRSYVVIDLLGKGGSSKVIATRKLCFFVS